MISTSFFLLFKPKCQLDVEVGGRIVVELGTVLAVEAVLVEDCCCAVELIEGRAVADADSISTSSLLCDTGARAGKDGAGIDSEITSTCGSVEIAGVAEIGAEVADVEATGSEGMVDARAAG